MSTVGFCWGAKIAIQLSGGDSYYSSTCLIHPSRLTVEDAEAAQAPLLMITSIEETELSEFMEVLYKKPFGDKCKHVHFDGE
jgi:dienelactone hydrolase